MGSAVKMRTDYSAAELRRLAGEDDNKPFGGAEREGFGGFDNDMDDEGGYNG